MVKKVSVNSCGSGAHSMEEWIQPISPSLKPIRSCCPYSNSVTECFILHMKNSCSYISRQLVTIVFAMAMDAEHKGLQSRIKAWVPT